MPRNLSAYTFLDDDNRMTGHFCAPHKGECYHCKAGVPFQNPPPEILSQLRIDALDALLLVNHERMVEASRAFETIYRERLVAQAEQQQEHA